MFLKHLIKLHDIEALLQQPKHDYRLRCRTKCKKSLSVIFLHLKYLSKPGAAIYEIALAHEP